MRLRTLLAPCLLVAAFAACDGNNNPTTPPPPAPTPTPTPTLAGNWAGTQTMNSIQPNDLCISYGYAAARLNVAETVTVTFGVDGSTVTISYQTPTGTYSATGTLTGQSFTATTSGVNPASRTITCRPDGTGNPVQRIVTLLNQTIQGTADANFTTINGSVTTKEDTHSPSGAHTDPVTTVAALALHK